MLRFLFVLPVALIAACSVNSGAIAPGDLDGGDSATDSGRVDACIPSAESCNAADDDCDGTVDEGFDTATDLNNCGACGTACVADPANAEPSCVGGVCQLICALGFADCNGDEADGCEANFATSETCGGCSISCAAPMPLCQADVVMSTCVDDCEAGTTLCGTSCVDTQGDVLNCMACGTVCPNRPRATRECQMGACGFTCDSGWRDCDTTVANGCEASINDVATCGNCGTRCEAPNTIPSCVARSCEYACLAGFDSCDGSVVTGCETPLNTRTNCGGCGVGCRTSNATGGCSTGSCVLTCNSGFDDCNTDGSDGCEASLDTTVNCGTCGNACASGETCIGGVCLATCPGMCTENCDESDPCGCAGGDSCDFTCGTSNCTADCLGSGTVCTANDDGVASNFVGSCVDGANCDFGLRGTSNITVNCTGAGTICDIECRDSSNCTVACDAGAECIIDCQNTSTCEFSSCTGTETNCGGNDIVCNRSCP